MAVVTLSHWTRWLPLGVATLLSVIASGPLHGAEEAVRVDLGGGVAMELVRIEEGSFQQGSPTGEPQRGSDETQRTVTMTKPFYLGKYPVTRGEFSRFVNETRYRTEAEAGTSGGFGWDGTKVVQRRDFNWKSPGFPQTDAHPVTIVTYADARAFLTWLSRKAGRTFSLPSEAQWEYACRAGSATAFPNGDDAARVADIAWFRTNAGQGTQPVGGKALNAWGLGDMPGNVWQWCEDWYAPYAADAAQDPLQKQSNLSDKPRRVLRGGSWLRAAADLRSAARYRNDPASRNADNGFRVMTFDAARTASVPATAAPKLVPEQTVLVESTTGNAGSDHIVPDARIMRELEQGSHDDSVARPASRGSGFGGLFVGIAVLGVIAVIIVAIVRAFARSGGTGVQPGNMASTSFGPVRTRVVDDGFWIESSTLPAGSVVECRYIVDGKQIASEATFQGGSGGQFVFTGSRPSSVSIVVRPIGGVGRPGGSYGTGFAGGLLSSSLDQPPPVPPDRDRFRSHPPAY